jgi:hypothetical protein
MFSKKKKKKRVVTKKVQTQVAQRLNLEATMDESLERMAIRLYQRLEKEEKFLLNLGDVWEEIAEAIAKRCCGLPLAIMGMGTAMGGKTMV